MLCLQKTLSATSLCLKIQGEPNKLRGRESPKPHSRTHPCHTFVDNITTAGYVGRPICACAENWQFVQLLSGPLDRPKRLEATKGVGLGTKTTIERFWFIEVFQPV